MLFIVPRSEEHTSELQSHSEISYAVFCLKKKTQHNSPRSLTSSTPTACIILSYMNPLHYTLSLIFFFFHDTATTEIYTIAYTLSLHDALPISYLGESQIAIAEELQARDSGEYLVWVDSVTISPNGDYVIYRTKIGRAHV